MKKEFNNIFKWNKLEFFKAFLGTLLFCIGLNIFIVPNNLYNGGVLGLSEILRTIINDIFNIHTSFDYSGIINFIINIPLFILAYFKIGKTFFARSIYCVLLQTIFLSIIPIPDTLIVEELITSVLLGGLIAGLGSGLTLSSAASGGGTDIIGIMLTQKNRNLSVGKVGFTFNVVLYITSGLLYGYEIMLYSIIYAFIESVVVEKTHDQNVCLTAIIFTKHKPTGIRDYIRNELDRGCTFWEATGGYNGKKSYITYLVCSRHELQKLERNLRDLDNSAFLVKKEGVGVNGNFKKNLYL